MGSEDDPYKSAMVQVETKSSFNGTYYRFETRRPLDPMKGKKIPINGKRRLDGDGDKGVPEFNQVLPVNKAFDMQWAECDSTAEIEEHNMYGIFKMTLPQGGGLGVVTTYSQRYLNHGIILWVAWFLLGFFMIVTNRWFPHMSNNTGYAHAFFGYSIVAMNVYAALNIISLNKIKTYNIHNLLGLVMSIGLIFFGATGSLSFIAKKRL